MRTVLQNVRRIANEIFAVKGLRKPLASLQGRVFILFKTIWQIKVKKIAKILSVTKISASRLFVLWRLYYKKTTQFPPSPYLPLQFLETIALNSYYEVFNLSTLKCFPTSWQ